MWRVGQRIGDYELVANLRTGGMATLFLGKRVGPEGFSRVVAVKMVHPGLAADEQFRTMLIDEAMVASRIQHPNVVHVEALGEHQGAHYLVMEYVHGCSLAQLQRTLVERGRRLAPAFSARIAMFVAEALHAAHETRDEKGRLLQVVHRDVSPENVLLAYAGHVKLIDFGIAKAYGRKHKTEDGLLKGKFRYMAPEQAYGKQIDRRTDIYQLGIVLWEMLTLRRLFDAETDVELLQQVREPRVPPPSTLVPFIPPALDAAVLSALHPDPNRRPADALSFARTLSKAMPTAHEVDSGALSALLLALMKAQRAREKNTFPPLVYEGLEREIITEPLGTQSASGMSVMPKFTVEHEADGSRAQHAPSGTAPGYSGGAEVDHNRPNHRDVKAAGESPARERRLVRVASELRTTITRMAQGSSAQRVAWLVGGVLLGSVAFVLVSWALRATSPAAPTSRVPTVPQVMMAPGSRAPQPLPTSVGTASSPASPPLQEVSTNARPEVAPELDSRGSASETSHARPPQPSPGSSDRSEARDGSSKLPLPQDVAGTPLIGEPGF